MSLLALVLALAAGSAPSWAQTSTAPPERIVAALRDGGHVVYFRHGVTTGSGIDRIEWPREHQRLLSERGIANSRRIGAAFREREIPVGEVLASPFARCRDMAEIMFGRVEEHPELLGLLSDADGRPARVAWLRERMRAMPTSGTNRVIVSHRSNIAELTGASLAEGEALIVTPDGDGFSVLGTMSPEDW